MLQSNWRQSAAANNVLMIVVVDVQVYYCGALAKVACQRRFPMPVSTPQFQHFSIQPTSISFTIHNSWQRSPIKNTFHKKFVITNTTKGKISYCYFICKKPFVIKDDYWFFIAIILLSSNNQHFPPFKWFINIFYPKFTFIQKKEKQKQSRKKQIALNVKRSTLNATSSWYLRSKDDQSN